MTEEHRPERIARVFVYDEVYQRLRRWIIEGRLLPGHRLRDHDLAEEFGVSRTPIRESLLRLEADGLVITHANRSTLVAPYDWSVIIRRYPLIWTLERYAVTAVSADVWTPQALEELSAQNRRLTEAVRQQDPIAAAKADEDFHNTLTGHTDNPELRSTLTELKMPLLRVEIAYFHAMLASTRSLDEHDQILAGLTAHHLEQAAWAVENNWRQSLTRMHDLIGQTVSPEAGADLPETQP